MQTASPLLKAVNLTKSYSGTRVVDGMSFEISPGEVLGLLGPNGAGKSTTVGMLYGLIVPESGEVLLGEQPFNKDVRRSRSRLGVVTQDDNLDQDVSVKRNLFHFASYYGHSKKEAERRASKLLSEVNLEEYENSTIESLSGGLKRRLVLARALVNDPDIIFLDEPTSGLDPDARQQFWRLVLDLKQRGKAVLLTTHYMEEASRLCDRLLLLSKGKVIDEGAPIQLVRRRVGKEVVEVSGVEAWLISEAVIQYNVWHSKFSDGFIISLPEENPEPLWLQIGGLSPKRLVRREANLDDVFIKLTGGALE